MKKKDIGELAFKALKEAVRDAVKEHKRADLPLAVWRDGRVMLIKPWKKSGRR